MCGKAGVVALKGQAQNAAVCPWGGREEVSAGGEKSQNGGVMPSDKPQPPASSITSHI